LQDALELEAKKKDAAALKSPTSKRSDSVAQIDTSLLQGDEDAIRLIKTKDTEIGELNKTIQGMQDQLKLTVEHEQGLLEKIKVLEEKIAAAPARTG